MRYRQKTERSNVLFVEKRDHVGKCDIYVTFQGEELLTGLYRKDQLKLKKGAMTYRHKKILQEHCGVDLIDY